MAILVANLGFNLSIEGNKVDEDAAGNPDVGAKPTGRKGFEEWILLNVTTFHDVEYGDSFTREVVVYE